VCECVWVSECVCVCECVMAGRRQSVITSDRFISSLSQCDFGAGAGSHDREDVCVCVRVFNI